MIEAKNIERLLNIGATDQSLSLLDSWSSGHADTAICDAELQILFVRTLRLSGQHKRAQKQLYNLVPRALSRNLQMQWNYEHDFLVLMNAGHARKSQYKILYNPKHQVSEIQRTALRLWLYCTCPENGLEHKQSSFEPSDESQATSWLAAFLRDYAPYLKSTGKPLLEVYGFHEQLAFAMSCPDTDCRTLMFATLALNAALHSKEFEYQQMKERYQMECLALSSGAAIDLYNLFGKSTLKLEGVSVGWKRFFKKIKVTKDILYFCYMQADIRKKRHHERILQTAQRLSHHFWAMKGPTMKMHQIADPLLDIFPDEIRTIYLTSSFIKPSLPPSRVRKVLEEDLGKPINEIFSYVSEYPIASASIGQVHKAKLLTGETVAVKVQYPEMRLLRQKQSLSLSALSPFIRFMFPTLNTRDFRQYVAQQYDLELDFKREQMMMDRIRTLLVDDDLIAVPRTFPQWTTPRVLTMEYIDGLRSDSLRRLRGNQSQIDRLGTAVIKALHRLQFKHSICCPDAHPDNFLFKDKVAYLIDFGSYQELSPPITHLNRALYSAVFRRDRDEFAQLAEQSGWLRSSSNDTLNAFYDVVEMQMKHIMGRKDLKEPNDYLSEVIGRIKKVLRHVCIPMEQLTIMRFSVMCHALVLTLKPQLNWHRELHDMIYLD